MPITSRTLRELPPRRLGWYSQAVLLFGDRLSQIGWALIATGSLFFWNTAARSELRIHARETVANWREMPAQIERADSTAGLEGGERIWRYVHAFDLEGWRYRGQSYSVGKKFDPGQIAYVRFDPADPTRNYLIGNRRHLYAAWVNIGLMVPLLGLLLAAWPLRQNLRFIRLLKIGDFTRGRLLRREIMGRSVTQGATVMPVFRYVFQFEHLGSFFSAYCQTHHTNLVEDEESEIILFDRFKPSFNLVYDALPDAPSISSAGKLAPISPWKARLLFLPAFSVVFNLVCCWMA